MNSIEVCFTPALFPFVGTRDRHIVVIADILRATTSICTALEFGVSAIIPVASLDEAREYKKKGFLVASERDGQVLDFADFGNSPFNFMTDQVKDQTIVYCTTNGTQAIELAKKSDQVVLGAVVNITALTNYLIAQDCNILVFCSGWKNKFCTEDAVFAGMLAERLMKSGHFGTDDDSTKAALDMWSVAKPDLIDYVDKAEHRHRLKRLGLDDIMEYTFTPDQTHVVPVLVDGKIVSGE